MKVNRRWLLGLSLVGLLSAPYLLCDLERATVSAEHRQSTGGDYLDLGVGTVHYERRGPAADRCVVLIHGVSGPMEVWDPTVETLEGAGACVLRFDLLGRGTSDRPDTTYDLDLYYRQLDELLAALSIDGEVDLVGSSMGAIIAAGYATRSPERVRRLVLIGPAGFPLEASPLARLMGIPGVGEYIMTSFGDRQLQAHNRRYFYRPERVPEYHAAFDAQLRFRGTKRAILSTMRSVPVQSFEDGYAAAGALAKPTLIIWGEEDQTFPFSNHVRAQELLPQASLIPVPEAAHLPQYERPEVVGDALTNFLGNALH